MKLSKIFASCFHSDTVIHIKSVVLIKRIGINHKQSLTCSFICHYGLGLHSLSQLSDSGNKPDSFQYTKREFA